MMALNDVCTVKSTHPELGLSKSVQTHVVVLSTRRIAELLSAILWGLCGQASALVDHQEKAVLVDDSGGGGGSVACGEVGGL